MAGYILAIDQGTTSTRAIVFDDGMRIVGVGQQEFAAAFSRAPAGSSTTRRISGSRVVDDRAHARSPTPALRPSDIAAIGITNQRETVVVWDRETGKPIHNAIVWQDRRTAELCAQPEGGRARSRCSPRRPGCCSIPISPAPRSPGCSTNVEGARAKAERGRARLRHRSTAS